MHRKSLYPQLGPEGGPGVLGPWQKLPRPRSPADGRRARARLALAGGAAALAVAVHCVTPLV